MPNISQYLPISDPTLIFFVVLLIILTAPIVMGKLRIPHIIGMVLAGVLVGEHGLNLLARDSSFELFGKVGIYYIMFLAALEMDRDGLRKHKARLIAFGALTFSVPYVMCVALGVWCLGYGWTASLMLGCIMASNTLIAYPLVCRYGLQRKPSVALSVGGSMISLFMALVALAAIVGTHMGSAGPGFWLWLAVRFAAFCALMVWLIPRAARCFLRNYSDAVMQFIFVLAVMFMSAALSEAIGLEGIFGAFFAGLVLGRYVPRLSPLMSRIEFTGNAIFIPYFLIGVGMLIDVRLLFEGGSALWAALLITLVGTVGKGIAAYGSAIGFRLRASAGNMMFGLTTAHAAGAIAIVMVGVGMHRADGTPVVGSDMLNAVVLMILLTCVISSVLTERAAQQLTLRDKNERDMTERSTDDEKIIIAMKSHEDAEQLLDIAIMMRNNSLNRGLVALNVVYDDAGAHRKQEEGRRLLDEIVKQAGTVNVMVQTQVRIAANIANGIRHAFKEFSASEIIIGLHRWQGDRPKEFWGEFQRSLYNGLNRQIIMAMVGQPLSTLRCIQVCVPSRAEFETGFYRWLERMSRMADNIGCRIRFHGRQDTLSLIREYVRSRHPSLRAEYARMEKWSDMPAVAAAVPHDHLFAIVTARKGTISYKSALERMPSELTKNYHGQNMMIIFPEQFGDQPAETMTFTVAQHQEEHSAYDIIRIWMNRLLSRRNE